MFYLNFFICFSQKTYNENKAYFIEHFLLEKIGEEFKVKTLNKFKNRTIILDHIIISIPDNHNIINEFGKKELKIKHVKIYSIEQLKQYDEYMFVYAFFIDKFNKKQYQTTYTFAHKEQIKKIEYSICYKIKNNNGYDKKLSYLHIKTF